MTSTDRARPMEPPVPNWDLPTLAGAGGLRSTGDDLLKFVRTAMATNGAQSKTYDFSYASRARATVGEVMNGLADVFGRYEGAARW